MSTVSSTSLNREAIPRHVAVIMDGNGRWARGRGLPRLEGHRKGYSTLKSTLDAAAELGVEVLTAYAFSSENWLRPRSEVSGIMRLIQYAARSELAGMKREGVRIVLSGRIERLPDYVRRQLLKDVEATSNNTRITLNLAVNYGGRAEIVDAARAAAEMVAEGTLKPEEIDEKLLSSLMYQPDLPDPDLLIRTAGELRVSNFLLWEMAYTEIYVTSTLWPDFDQDELVAAIASYQQRVRRFGAVVEKDSVRQEDTA